jgi:hypothetical protein
MIFFYQVLCYSDLMFNNWQVNFHKTCRRFWMFQSKNDNLKSYSIFIQPSPFTVKLLYVIRRSDFFLRLIYCSEMYKCVHELYIKTVPGTNQFTWDFWLNLGRWSSYRWSFINHLTPNDHFSGRTALLTYRCCIFLFIQQICVLNILNMLHTLRFFLFKMLFIS